MESNEGEVRQLSKGPQPTNFKTEEDAAKANDLFKESHGYKEQVVYCEPCRAWHLKHVYSVDLIARGASVEQAVVGQ